MARVRLHRGFGWIGGVLVAGASAVAQEARPGPIPAAEAVPPASAGAGAVPLPEVVYEGTPLPGSRVAIGPDGPPPPETSFRWEQVEGPAVAIDDPSSPRIEFVVPPGAGRLAFALTLRDGRGERTTRVVVPVAAPASPAAAASEPRPAPEGGPTADAGDDQIGLVGRRITLDGSRSRPAGRVGFRWVQVVGPPVGDQSLEGPFFSFVPTAPGIYRFALLVGLDSRVSEPDVVAVEVGRRPEAASAWPPEAATVRRWVETTLPALPRGPELSGPIAEAFEAAALRMPLYGSFAEFQAELARRLDAIVPAEPGPRAAWAAQLFAPLTQYVGAELVPVGIDIRVPASLARPLDAPQKDRLGAICRDLAAAFRGRPASP
jgi:hypothetical protein